MKTPLGTEVDLSPGHIVLNGVPALHKRGTAAPPPLFSVHVYCDHGRPSQLLLSSCTMYRLEISGLFAYSIRLLFELLYMRWTELATCL